MPLIVKIMSDDNFSDDSPYKRHNLITGVVSLEFLLSRGAEDFSPCVLLYFGRGEEPEYHHVWNNVYVMNENGKTISSWAVPVQIPQNEIKVNGNVTASTDLEHTVDVFLGRSPISLLDRTYKGSELADELGISVSCSLQLLEFDDDTTRGRGQWVTVLPDARYHLQGGDQFRAVPD